MKRKQPHRAEGEGVRRKRTLKRCLFLRGSREGTLFREGQKKTNPPKRKTRSREGKSSSGMACRINFQQVKEIFSGLCRHECSKEKDFI